MKEIYFVRHGESEGNRLKIHQSTDTPLTEIGLSQAEIIALRFSKIPDIEIIIASPCLRAQQTARAIANKNHLEIETNELFTEKRNPSQLNGLAHQSQESLVIRREISEHLFEQEGKWRYSDEESVSEFVLRTKQALEFLSQRTENKIIVVCHALILHMILSTILNPTGNLETLYASIIT
jgi:probable phosphoglycerate mutase